MIIFWLFSWTYIFKFFSQNSLYNMNIWLYHWPFTNSISLFAKHSICQIVGGISNIKIFYCSSNLTMACQPNLTYQEFLLELYILLTSKCLELTSTPCALLRPLHFCPPYLPSRIFTPTILFPALFLHPASNAFTSIKCSLISIYMISTYHAHNSILAIK